MRQLILSLVVSSVVVAGCAGDSGDEVATPTSPTVASTTQPGPQTQLAVSGISSVPDGAGVQFTTDFQFTASGAFPSGTEFVWNFGDGSTTTTSTPTVSRIFGQAGVFSVSVTARRGSESAVVTKAVSVRSLVGRWTGRISGFTAFPTFRPVPMTSFEMLITGFARDGETLWLQGRWSDNAGCRESRNGFFRQRLDVGAAAMVTFGVDELSCANGAFYLTGSADSTFDNVEGHCNVMGNNPNCRFSMKRE